MKLPVLGASLPPASQLLSGAGGSLAAGSSPTLSPRARGAFYEQNPTRGTSCGPSSSGRGNEP